jgi:hypothetical protein
MPAPVPQLNQPSFKLPSGLLEVHPSSTGEAVMSAVFGPFVQLVEENIPLLLGLTGLGICFLVGGFVIKYVAGRGAPRNPHLTAYERGVWTEYEMDGGTDFGMGEGPDA